MEPIDAWGTLWLGLIINQLEPRFGYTNDGIIDPCLFENSDISASITGVDKDLIGKFHVILQAIWSGHDINLISFEDYALQNVCDFVQLIHGIFCQHLYINFLFMDHK